MGLLSCGTPLNWEDTKILSEYVRQHGINQFINVFQKLRNRKADNLKWGDELEYTIVYVDHKSQTISLCMCAEELLTILQKPEEEDSEQVNSLWRMEFASYMIEGTPGKPFCCDLSQLNLIETSLRIRREETKIALQAMEKASGILEDPTKELMVLNFAAFPRIGCLNFTYPPKKVEMEKNIHSKSLWFPDEGIFQGHPRFINLSRNIRQRRGEKPKIYVPVFKDENTESEFMETIPPKCGDDGEGLSSLKPDHIYMDCMAFGMGCSCLQITLQAKNICEARLIYDQLLAIAPLLMTLSASSPAWKGILAEWDCRWKIISMSVDDRTQEEREINDCTGVAYVPKSRYDSASMYIHPKHDNYHLNDTSVPYNHVYYEKLMNSGIDKTLAKHVAHLFIRDSISMFAEKVVMDDNLTTDHFENIQSTNWQTVRFKPPPPDSNIGWRVEFRPLECQITDFENSAYVMFVILFTRVITIKKLDILVPMSMVDANMNTASMRNAATNGLFHFKTKRYFPELFDTEYEKPDLNEGDPYGYSLLTMDEIMNGTRNAIRKSSSNPSYFPGLIPIIMEYIETSEEGQRLAEDTKQTIARSMDLISKRASGQILTTASWMRKFFTSHSDYKKDSRASSRMVYDISLLMNLLASGEVHDESLLGSHHISCDLPQSLRSSYQEMIRRNSSSFALNNTSKNCPCSEKFSASPPPPPRLQKVLVTKPGILATKKFISSDFFKETAIVSYHSPSDENRTKWES